ncbi:FecR domain-containing protein [Parabacteroides sp. merdae-related_45_40]|uniref:FecR family protein n=1 Tax=Parabacteroides sp. merdae-related_45_40 TaxID=1897013 RepID=UPI0009641E03|nr:FecR domain-containing protein [Parabacteroides sp. merdae-related_45_40]OKZ33478.1 MAG: anti-sigma factor [Parabacteroides sp. merdae-related_45_40]
MEEQKTIKDYIVDYLLDGEDEKRLDPVLVEWLAEDESHRKEFNLYKKIWEESHRYTEVEAFDPDLAWEKVDKINRQKVYLRKYWKNMLYTASGVAASLLIVLALSFMGTFQKGSEVLVSMSADYGNRSEIMLPDGSLVKLNAGSEVVYSYDPKKKTREVDFQGEGFFDVSKSKDPFVIKVAASFNLQAYADDPVIQASLVGGCIELEKGNEKLRMKPGEIAVFDKKTDKIKQVEGVLSHSYGWLDNKLYMEDMSLSVVCKYLERWYDVKIMLQPGLGENIRYNGVIQEETVTDVMNALSRLSKIRYHVTGKNISKLIFPLS